ncbi:OmpA family protein [Desertimonas flava]|jgi:outer membrane protein OmpA-like peptidoglycan-associated protein|uniref:OmpA family protein n=1 Tax=Desertimonas flava TaxID=2064846 RepID=UPI000E342CC1|nr:OmpA family protein [Desertimonas flava]
MNPHRRRLLNVLVPAVAAGALGLSACGGGSSASGGTDPDRDGSTVPTSAVPAAPAGSDVQPFDGGDDDREGDGVVFVTNAPTTTSTTTTRPPTTTTVASTTRPPTTTVAPTTSTSVPPPTSVRCSFAADALFDPGDAVLHDEAVADLARLAAEVAGDDDHSVRTVRVEGRTDHRGSDDDNLALSEDRAAAAAEALVAAGIDPDLVTTEGLGETEALQPTADHEPTEDEMAGDRRVDVVIDADVPITASCQPPA